MTEKYHYIVNVEAAIFKDDKWLVTQRSEQEPHAPGTLSMPGGKVEVSGQANDVLEEAVKREVMEEAGIEIDVLDYVSSSAFVTDDGRQAVDVVFLCKYQNGEAKPLDAEEIAAVHWMTLDEISRDDNTPEWTRKGFQLASGKKVHE